MHEELLKKHRKKPLVTSGQDIRTLAYRRKDIERIIPHREPFLLLDHLTGIDLSAELITGTRFIDQADPVFRGHFPGYPVYPGVLELEMIGQLGLCLQYFLKNGVARIGEDAKPVSVRATRVLGAYYLEPVLPGVEVQIVAQKLESDDILARIIGQILRDTVVCCVAVCEGCLVD